MNVLIVGAHGRTARLLIPLLVDDGHTVLGVVRGEAHIKELQSLGATPFVVDLSEGDLSTPMNGIDAVVFTAAGGSHEYDTVDHRGAARVAHIAEDAGVRRFVLLSANGADAPNSWGPAYADYLSAKRAGEEAVAARNLDWTILRPGALTDGGGTGRITLLTSPGGTGSISRRDVARTLAALLPHDGTIGKTLELWSGSTPIVEAVASV